jgi:hypothetical protein
MRRRAWPTAPTLAELEAGAVVEPITDQDADRTTVEAQKAAVAGLTLEQLTARLRRSLNSSKG